MKTRTQVTTSMLSDSISLFGSPPTVNAVFGRFPSLPPSLDMRHFKAVVAASIEVDRSPCLSLSLAAIITGGGIDLI